MKLFSFIRFKFHRRLTTGKVTGIRDKGVWVDRVGFDSVFVPWDRIVNEN